MNCSGKTAIVAGGFGGIGFATCRSLLARGVKNLAIFDVALNAELLGKLSETNPTSSVKFWKVDVTRKSEIDDAFKAVVKEFNSIDILVTAVGVVDEMDPKRCIQINLTGVVYLNYAAVDYMSTSKGGKGGLVANVASVAGIEPFPIAVTYTSTKFGIIGLTRSLGNDFFLSTTGIKFMAICPGFTDTAILAKFSGSPLHGITEFPKKIILQTAEECGELLVAALETDRNGSIWMIDGGQSKEILMPSFYDVPTE